MDEFLRRHGIHGGFRSSVQSFYDMSRDWYRGRTDVDWEPPTAEEAVAVWRRHGFTGEFWEL